MEESQDSRASRVRRARRTAPPRRLLSAISALVVASLLALAAPVAARPAKTSSPGGDVLRATLPNGLRVVIVRNRLAPVATTIVNYMVGSNEAPAGFPGTAHAQEPMMFRGSPGLTASQLADIIAGMGGDMNADTQQTVTQYFFEVPTQDLEVALHVQSIRMRGVLDDEKLWDQERGAIEQEVAQDLSNPQYVFYTKLLKAMFEGTPYEHDALGTKPSFDKTTGKMLKKFYDTWYAPNNAILVVVGDVDPQSTLATVKKLFGPIPAKKIPPRPEVHLKPVKPATMDLTTDLPYGLAVVAFRMPGFDNPDYAASLVLADVLSSRRGSLYALVPKGKALYAGFQNIALPKSGIGFTMAVFPKGADTKALVKEVRQILATDVAKGLPPDLIRAAKRRELTDAEDQKNSVMGLAMSWSQALAVEGKSSPQDDIDAIEKVTVADVNRVARKYLDLDHAIVAVLKPQPSGKPTSSKGFGGRESFTPKNPKPVELPDWAKKQLAKVFVPESNVHPVVTTLPNGLRLIVQPASVSDTVKLYG
ncbi:MAG TPA: insulinase family protein, partial [Acidobacteria bacterium]|nr:insulinase family protein [Acidobacteriota bacterium]